MDETKLGPCFADAQGNGMKKATEAWKRRASMGDFISREAVLKAFENADADVMEDYGDGTSDWGFGRQNIRDVIASVPTADVEPVRNGNWNIRHTDESTLCLECSVCGRRVANTNLRHLLELGEYGEACRGYPYCHCGAKMDLEGKTDN